MIDPIQENLNRITDDLMRRFLGDLGERTLDGYTDSTATNDMGDGLTLADLSRAVDYIKSLPAFCKAIWFVDCKTDVRLLSEISKVNKSRATTLYGIKVIEWQHSRDFNPAHSYIEPPAKFAGLLDNIILSYVKESGKRILPWFVAIPGIWAEMSDGKHIRVEVKN